MHTFIKSCIHKSPKGKRRVLLCAGLLLLGLMLLSVCVGAVAILPGELWRLLTGGHVTQATRQIFYFVRVPRTLAAVLAGAALACAGTILQTVLDNPLCSPNIIGVNAGAGLFMILIAAFFPAAAGYAPVSAFLGALVAVSAVYILAKRTGASRLAIVLAGVAISSLLSALTDTVITLVPQVQVNRIDFLIGSFSHVSMAQVGFALPYMLAGLLIPLLFHTDMNLLALGDSTAGALGLRVPLMRGLFLACAALLAGSAISLAGLIGFVGLLIPHAARKLIGYDHKYLLPLSILLGASFCLLCDFLARVLFVPFELPVGIVMSLIGSPFFIWLVFTRKRRVQNVSD